MDLALWEPASAAAVNKANAKSVMYSCMDLLQPAVTSEERFLMCKSALKEGKSERFRQKFWTFLAGSLDSLFLG